MGNLKRELEELNMKLRDLLNVLRSTTEIIDWNTMKKIGEYNTTYFEILDEDMEVVTNLEELNDKEVVFENNRFHDKIRVLVK